MFNGIFIAVTCPHPKESGLEDVYKNATSAADEPENGKKAKENKKTKEEKRRGQTTLGSEEVNDFIKQAAKSAFERTLSTAEPVSATPITGGDTVELRPQDGASHPFKLTLDNAV